MSGLAALGAGLGGFADYWQRQQQQNRQNAALALQLKAIQQQNQAAAAAWPAVLSGLAQQSQAVPQPQTQVPQTPVGTGMASFNPTSLLPPPKPGYDQLGDKLVPNGGGAIYLPQTIGGGTTSSGARIPPTPTGFPVGSTSLPDRLSDSQVAQIGPLVNRDESGDRNVPNFRFDQGHTASGVAQITDSTWQDAAPKAGVDIQQYPTAMSAPIPVQNAVRDYLLKTRGVQPWAPYNPKLRADLAGGGASDAEPNPQQELVGTLRNMVGAAQSSIDPIAQGRASIKAVAQAIDQANPDAPPIVKMMALEQAQKLLAPSEQVQLAMMKQMYQDQFRIGLAELQGQLRANAPMTPYQQEEIELRRQQGAPEQIVQQGGKTYRIPRGGQPEEIQFPGDGPVTKLGGASQAGQVQFTDQDVDYWAQVLKSGGSFPPGLARGSSGSAFVQRVMKRMGESGTSPGDFIANHATVAADATSLRNMTKMADAAVSFERTAKENFDLALSQSKGAIPTDWGPWINKWVEQGETGAGNKDVPPYVTALLTAANEYAKIMSGSTGSTGSTVDSRREAAELFSPYLNQGQIERVVAIAEADMANRKQSLYGQLNDIRGRLRSGGTTEPQPSAGGPAAFQPSGGKPPSITDQKAYDALAPGAHYIGPDGKPYIKGGQQ